MMYHEKMVVSIKHNGKILRENGDLVTLPFGSEFSVLVKNLNSRRAKFTLHIDGQDVLDGTEIIVNANSEVEMKRFIRQGNMDEGNAFKFIERTAAIENGPRGVKVDDGVVRVQFWFEEEAPIVTTHYHRDIWWDDYYRRWPYYGTICTNNVSSSEPLMKGMIRSAVATAQGATSDAAGGSINSIINSVENTESLSTNVNDVGITVPGSKVEQKFTTVYGFKAEANSNVIIIRMTGFAGSVEVAKPVTVKSKQKCTTCGHMNKASSKFCTECGTALELL